MTGQIPPYGKNFKLDQGEWDAFWSRSIYSSKKDSKWSIRSDHTSHQWFIMYRGKAVHDLPFRTLGMAMESLVDFLNSLP